MFLLLKLAWRNSFRNKRRTFLAGLAIGIGLAGLIFTDALIIGMAENMIKTATSTYLGQVQIHRRGFSETYEIEKTIANSDKVLEDLKNDEEVRNFTPRTLSFAMITSPANVSSILLNGINPATEAEISKVDDAIVKGEFLNSGDENKILVGSKLAETLEIDLGDRVVVTLAQAETGDLSQGMFRVGGIFHFNSAQMDGNLAFINLPKSQELMGLGNRIHEIALNLKGFQLEVSTPPGFLERYSQNGNIAQGWDEILPELASALSMSQFSIFILAIILSGIVALGIMNTLFMSLYERMFEFGVLRAVGTRPTRMSLLIIFEAATLGIISIIMGAVIGFVGTMIVSVYGIDYTGIEYAGVTMMEPIYPVLTASQFWEYPLYLFFFTILIGLYPAVFAAKITPARAMKRSM